MILKTEGESENSNNRRLRGTGKSTLARYISEKENIKWIDTDNYL
ncbi:shikimate kinase [Oceanobacillus arenosus]